MLFAWPFCQERKHFPVFYQRNPVIPQNPLLLKNYWTIWNKQVSRALFVWV
jgi:hypothetical protein